MRHLLFWFNSGSHLPPAGSRRGTDAPGAGEKVIGASGDPVPDAVQLAVVDGLAHRAGADGGPIPGQAGDLNTLDPGLGQLWPMTSL